MTEIPSKKHEELCHLNILKGSKFEFPITPFFKCANMYMHDYELSVCLSILKLYTLIYVHRSLLKRDVRSI